MAHAVYRRQPSWGRAAQAGGATAADDGTTTDGETALYCRLEPAAGGASAEQMELFPVEPARLVPDVQRQVHRRLGSEGVKLLALLLQRLDRSAPGEVVHLRLSQVVAAGEAEPLTARVMRARLRRLWRLIEYLAQVELTRVHTVGDRCSVQSSRLATVLGRTDDRPAGPAGRSRDGEITDSHVRLVMDEVFHAAGEGSTLGRPHRAVPPHLLRLPAREHPFAVGLYAHLCRVWQHGHGAAPVTATARKLLQDAGFWIGTNARYRAVEQLKRDLMLLDERGVLGRWRMVRSPQRDVLEDEYRLEPVQSGAEIAAEPRAGAPRDMVAGVAAG